MSKFYNPITKEICTKMDLFHRGIGTDNIQFLVDKSNFYILLENKPECDKYHVLIVDSDPIILDGISYVQGYKEELLSIDEIKQMKLDEINNQYEKAISQLTRGYPQTEISSWPKQEEEANSWVKDNAADVPFLTNLSIKREISMEILCQKVLDKALTFAMISGDLTGQRQRMEDELDKLYLENNSDDIILMNVNYFLNDKR